MTGMIEPCHLIVSLPRVSPCKSDLGYSQQAIIMTCTPSGGRPGSQDQAADQNLQEREVRARFHQLARGDSLRIQSGVQARIPIAGRNGGSSSGEGGAGAYRSNCIVKVARP